MPGFIGYKRKISIIAIICLLMILLMLSGCSTVRTNQIEDKIGTSSCKCMNVSGMVLGKPHANASIDLYRAEGFDYESIVAQINKAAPEQTTTLVDSNRSFSFYCLLPGHYLLGISTSAFDDSYGSPIAAKSRQDDLEVYPVLQGGNSQNLFSIFSIKRIS